MHRYDTDTERGWERGRSGRRDYPDFESGENWRGYDRRNYENRGWEPRGYEDQGYGDQGAWGQPYADEYRSQDWGRQFGREPYGRESGREGYGRQYGGPQSYGRYGSASRGRFAGRGPRNYQRSDPRLLEEINDRLTEHPEIDATEIEVKVNNGEVTLTGSVNERHQKRLAEDCADSVIGVKQVHNQIRVQQESGTQERKTAGSESQQPRELTGTRR